ncbi:heat shock 70 kDa protein 12A-like isoform X2 [Mytilus californianus]|uniref:heat shock 70 kDa protein 12A-like isoform X2 n=1 Tax=Mytilus californianus TaxID=6549 RepID=UPI002247CC24|nr:heat shock 70 kDa protein 12A-like isoform X2 [Mytilus californianus]
MEGILKKKISILRGFEDKWFKLTEDGFLEYYEIKPSILSQDTDVSANQIPSYVSGFGMKEGGLFGRRWERRYFVLSDCGFQYYTSETETTPQRTVSIEDIKGVANANGYRDKQSVFQLVTKNRTFFIEVETPSELEKWTKELSCCLQKREQLWLASLAPDKDDCTFRIITNSGETHILRSSQLMDRQKWIDAILDTQKSVNEDMGPFGVKLKVRGEWASGKTALTKEDAIVVSRKLSKSVGDKPGNLINQTMTEIVEPEDTNAYTKQTCLCVAAIDLGSSDSGCAFSMRSAYNLNPLNIHTEPLGDKGSEKRKSPTIVLMDPAGQFAAFGDIAQQQYEELALDEEDKEWFYFRRFKMQLYTKKGLDKDMMLEDINGREMKASNVFACCIEYIKNKVFKRAEEAVRGLTEEQVHWMITVPAIWNESARQFMREAATKAGINQELLTLVLEPEAAAVYCKYVEIRRNEPGEEANLEVFKPGSQFLIVDLGGGTVDITCNEVTETGQLQEIYHASGGPWGGNMINKRIWKLIRSIFGNAFFDQCMKKYTYAQLELLKAIEEGKMKISPGAKAVFKLPYEMCDNTNITSTAGEIIGGKIHINPKDISIVFESSIKQVCTHLSKVLARDETRNVKALLLVGGYASCKMLKERIKTTFNEYDIICPLTPEMIVLKGAVIMGHESRPIIGRLARFHYGLAVPSGLKLIQKMDTPHVRTEFYNELNFLPLILKGTPIRIGEEVAQYSFIVTSEELTDIQIGVLTCEDDKAPSTIAENNCTQIGQIEAKIPALSKLTEIRIIVSCDETEFKVTAVIEELGHRFSARCLFLH